MIWLKVFSTTLYRVSIWKYHSLLYVLLIYNHFSWCWANNTYDLCSEGTHARHLFSATEEQNFLSIQKLVIAHEWCYCKFIILLNKKFWEDLVAYFPWHDTDCIEDCVSNNSSITACVFVAAVKFLPSRCLATIGGYTQTTEMDLWSTPLRWAQVPWYTYRVSWRCVQAVKR
jgi:hypothetical protein